MVTRFEKGKWYRFVPLCPIPNTGLDASEAHLKSAYTSWVRPMAYVLDGKPRQCIFVRTVDPVSASLYCVEDAVTQLHYARIYWWEIRVNDKFVIPFEEVDPLAVFLMNRKGENRE